MTVDDAIDSNIIERHVHNSFYEYLNENNLINERQFGFRENTRAKRLYIVLLQIGYITQILAI